jgi:hypothetical protein
LPAAVRLSLEMERASRREAGLLERLGEAASAAVASSPRTDVQGALAEAARLGAQLQTVQAGLGASLAQDRSDYPLASPWAKPVVVLRGLLARVVLRDRARRIGAARRPLHRLLGSAWLEGTLQAGNGNPRPEAAALARAIGEQRRQRAAAEAERADLLEPFGGQALPEWAHAAQRECSAVLAAALKEARAALVPRLPSLAGLAAGWWVTHAYTASRWDRFLDGIGLRQGGPKVVSAETYQRLHFWLPLIAAALCAYLCARLATAVRNRYSPPSDDVMK